MADDDGNETRIGRIDLKLHLGLPPPSWRIAIAAGLGSDLALGRTAPVDMSQAPYSPSHASFDDPEHRSVEALAPPIQPPGVPVEAYDSMSRFGVNDRASPLADGPYSPLAPMQLYSPRSSWSNPRSPSNEPTLPRRLIRWSPYLSPSYDPTPPPYSPLSPSVAYTRTRWTPYSTPSPFEPSSPMEPSSPLESSSPIYEPRSPMYLSPTQPYEPRSPPYVPPSPYEPREPPRFLNEVDSGMPNSFLGRHGEFLSQEGGYSLQQELQSPEFRFRRSGEDNYRLRRSEFRVDPADGERSNNVLPLSPFSERLSNRIMRSQRERATYRKHDTTAKGVGEEGLDAETKEKIKNAANFECNICLDMAKEAVVTSCGHLFCWSCLYQWLHLHPDHKECPVCKGEVIESNITPIYGRGGSESSAKKKLESKEESSVAIPPRPRGNRFESYRQQVRPVSSNLGEGSGDRTVLPRIRRARRIHIGRGIRENAPISRETELPTDGTPVLGRSRESNAVGDGTDSSSGGSLPLPEPEGVAAVVAGIVRMSGRHALSRLLYGAASSVNPLAPVSLAADHSSTSSTMAVIQEDTTVVDESAEPNSAGSSRSRRRRRRSSASGFSDIDGEALHARNRRRLN